MKNKIGLESYQIKIGLPVYYYAWATEFENCEPEHCNIISDVIQMPDGELCCKIDIRSSVVSLENLSIDYYPKRILSKKKRIAKERYSLYNKSETTLSFGD